MKFFFGNFACMHDLKRISTMFQGYRVPMTRVEHRQSRQVNRRQRQVTITIESANHLNGYRKVGDNGV